MHQPTAHDLLQLHGGVGLAIGVLSRASNTAARCFQRATIHALVARVPPRGGSTPPQGWLELQGGGALLLRYVVSLPSSTVEELERQGPVKGPKQPSLPPEHATGDGWAARWMQELGDLGREYAAHGDLLPTSLPDGEASCAEKVFWTLRELAIASRGQAHYVAIADNDAFLHPTRLVADLLPFVAPSEPGDDHLPDVMFGQMSLAAGWDDAHIRHYGFGNGEVSLLRLTEEWATHGQATDQGASSSNFSAPRAARGRAAASDTIGVSSDGRSGAARGARDGQGGHGPFPFPLGFFAAVSRRLALDMGRVPAVASALRRLRDQFGERRLKYVRGGGRHAGKRAGKCDPATDASLGWAAAQVGRPITVVDVTSLDRVDLWRAARSPGSLNERLAVMHGAVDWAKHFRWALCKAARVEGFPYSTLAQKEERAYQPWRCNSGRCPHSNDTRPVMRCPPLHCPLDGCRRACGTRQRGGPAYTRCAEYINSTFAGWRFCEAEKRYPKRATPRYVSAARAELRNTSICWARRELLLSSCAAGFAPMKELTI